ncbi:lytic transglycosylase domain-containing protein [Paracidovorax avenae]|uniref:lytic transglycosylase domain-containing protein n=1 Tax=Paracidovorax avenae TaxID=80867 RepID=UPI0006B31B9B|nr:MULTISPECIES: lytic transglycosylase domain-containing protein [Comamonadaceae]AVS67564.1 lytic transglycosylase domain-containing protein [Paracidovorax avenae]AVS70666.1 lytic transglycosylase domain-containing protein [Paracidovorax avenae]AVS81230.1 lytic transglycosylase domain-containing protein [Paracidovorax avenae]AVS84994.1 lytic transglycosylase domain-containing protein [Paracidovorax avenae]AVT16445.1 lytic transglycosylase domain-containing protein [Paracidovorax avenae]
MTASGRVIGGVQTFASDVIDGFLEITHSSFALVGLTVAFGAITLTARPDLRQAGEEQLMGWLQARQVAVVGVPMEPEASERATATNPKDLPKEQAAVAFWLSKKYRVAPEPLAALVSEAYEIGGRTKLDPTLILAIMAVESSFNPFAQSAVGAQGLMQVMTRVHTDKYENFGGHFAAFDPVSNLRVGVRVLQECIARAGSLEGGLRYYVGAANLADDGGYAIKVMAEHMRLRQVANGRNVPIFTPPAPAAPATTPPMLSTQAPAQTTLPAKAAGTADASPAASSGEDKLALLTPGL